MMFAMGGVDGFGGLLNRAQDARAGPVVVGALLLACLSRRAPRLLGVKAQRCLGVTDSDRSIPVAQRLVHQHLVVLGCRRLRPASNRERDEGRANKEGCNGQEPDEDGRSAGAGLEQDVWTVSVGQIGADLGGAVAGA